MTNQQPFRSAINTICAILTIVLMLNYVFSDRIEEITEVGVRQFTYSLINGKAHNDFSDVHNEPQQFTPNDLNCTPTQNIFDCWYSNGKINTISQQTQRPLYITITYVLMAILSVLIPIATYIKLWSTQIYLFRLGLTILSTRHTFQDWYFWTLSFMATPEWMIQYVPYETSHYQGQTGLGPVDQKMVVKARNKGKCSPSCPFTQLKAQKVHHGTIITVNGVDVVKDITKGQWPERYNTKCETSHITRLYQTAPMFGLIIPWVAYNCIHSVLLSLLSRVAAVNGPIEATKAGKFLLWVREHMYEIFGDPVLIPSTVEAFLARYNGRQLSEHLNALGLSVEDMIEKGKEGYGHLIKRQVTDIKMFVKVEALIGTIKKTIGDIGIKTTIKDKLIKVPRAVQATMKLYNIIVGPFSTVFSKYITHRFNVDGEINFAIYATGMSREEYGRVWNIGCERIRIISGDHLVAYNLDFSRWDKTQNAWFRIICIEVLYHCFCGVVPKFVLWLLEQTLEHTAGRVINKKKMWKVYYKIYHCFTRSGEPTTSVFNTIINILIHIYGAWTYVPFNIRKLSDISLYLFFMALGDDNVGVLPVKHIGYVEHMKKIALSLGLKPEVEIVKLADASFCSSSFIPGRLFGKLLYYMVPSIPKMLIKLFYAKTKLGPMKKLGHAMAVSRCLYPTYAHIPFMEAFLRRNIMRGMRAGATEWLSPELTAKLHWMLGGKNNATLKPMSCSSETIQWLCERYDTTEDEINDLTEFIDRPYHPYTLLVHPLLTKMFRVDCSELKADVTLFTGELLHRALHRGEGIVV